MIRRPRTALIAAAVIGVIAPVAIASSPAAAVDDDLVVSATSGEPGTLIDVTSASCVEDGDTFRYLTVLMISGTAPDEVFAGIASGYEGEPAMLVVPNWVDPDAPLALEATCTEVTFDPDTGNDTETEFDYTPVAFDVLPAVDPVAQTVTLSRTQLQAGQAFLASGTGCDLVGADYASTDVLDSTDLSGRDWRTLIASGENLLGEGFDGGTLPDDDFETGVALTNGELGIYLEGGSDSPTVGGIEEVPTDIPDGTYVAISYCVSDDGAALFYEPELIDVDGQAPYGESDVTVPAESREVTFAGAECTAGPVTGFLESIDLDDLVTGAALTERRHASLTAAPALQAEPEADLVIRAGDAFASSASRRALADDGFVELDLAPDAAGAWSLTDTVPFDQGFVVGQGLCGDPLEDGFFYDAQGAEVSVTPDEPTTPTTTPTTPPAPAPATAVPGSPSYAG